MGSSAPTASNYAPLMVRNPPAGQRAPKNIFQTEGFTDTYAPNPAIEAFATALGGDIVQLTATRMPIEGLTLRGRTIVDRADHGQRRRRHRRARAVQPAGRHSDGHFVVFDITAAQKQSASSSARWPRTGQATVVSP